MSQILGTKLTSTDGLEDGDDVGDDVVGCTVGEPVPVSTDTCR